MFNGDGTAAFESQVFSAYPVQVIINELPMVVRTSEPIVCTLWFGKKPDMNVLLKGFTEEMNELSKFELNPGPGFIRPRNKNEENKNITLQQLIKCYNCGGKGHIRRDCWHSQGNTNGGY